MNTEEKQTKNENLEFILSILTTMLLTLISKDIASPFWKIIFMLCGRRDGLPHPPGS